MFTGLKEMYPYHGDISRIVRSAVKAIIKSLQISADGNISQIGNVPVAAVSVASHLSLMEAIEDDEVLKKIAIKNADSINESYYVKGIHSKEALKQIFTSFELSNIIKYKWVEKEEQSGAIIIYIEKTIYPPRIMKVYFNNYVDYFCKLNRLQLEISGDSSAPIYRISKQDGSVLI